ncbi:hypothetical protein DPMN_167650 [Dreissena polymorpha]|uniref:Uncharacterized protein n=1 Tax=Dreissena polymorpha TaxID=45954 RepID=A0A9D4IYJ6_DREPO|nr:hypothetical protein DPMN_167650 [Dreissena polymorpha]
MAPNVLVVFEGTRRLHASARLVHITEWRYTSGNTLPGKHVFKHTVTSLNTLSQARLYLLGMALHGNTYYDTLTG